MKEFNLELPQNELVLEEAYLARVIGYIQEEILRNTQKKRQVYDEIIEYRKGQLDEYRSDEDKQIDYFDHERYVQEESFKSVEKRLTELTELAGTPYFGKVLFREKEADEEGIYIGKYGLVDEESYDPLIIDWRAPIASLFYKGSLGRDKYQAPLGDVEVDITKRRQFLIRDAELHGVFDTESDVRDEILLEVLSSNVGKKLKDIIMTIQEEQDKIIRDRREGVVVVNGVAGSGKTTIALHRTAYLLYNHRKLLENKVLILGPNNMFMDYIAQVLPSLGEGGVHNNTFKDLALSLLHYHGPIFMGEDYTEALISGDEELMEDTRKKRSAAFQEALEQQVDITERTYFEFREIRFQEVVLMDAEEMERILLRDFKHMPFFKRAERLKRMLAKRLKDARDVKRLAIDKKYEELRKKMKASGEDTSEWRNMRRTDIRRLMAQVSLARDTFREFAQGDYFNAYVPFKTFDFLTEADIAPMLYLKHRLHGVKLPFTVQHLVLDEAQEYSLLHFKALKEITGCTSMTIVGDVNQMILAGESPMKDLSSVFDQVRPYHLTRSYRSTFEIMDFANRFLKENKIVPLVRNGKPVTEHLEVDLDAAVDLIAQTVENYRRENLDTVGILTRDMETTRQLHRLLRKKINVKLIDSEDALLKGDLYIMPAYFAKGLEFDGVIMAEKASGDAEESLIHYIMATRALHELTRITFQDPHFY